MEENSENIIIEQRKKKIINFFKSNPNLIFVGVVIILLVLGFYIRYLPLTDHNGKPGLWDVTTNDYTLGPDLDPFLFLRYAKAIIENGSLPQIDAMRNVPLGFETETELQMVSHTIVFTYKFLNIFGDYSINYAGAFMPIIFFLLTIIAFFLFVREIFIRKDEKKSYTKANWISSIATLLMIVVPEFLPRTVAGIPEKESIAFFFMFISFFFFLRAWKSDKITSSIIYGLLAGISTSLMGLSWGAVSYIFIPIALASLVGFILNKFNKNRAVGYAAWIIVFPIITFFFTKRYSLRGFLFGLDTGLSILILITLIVHFIIWKTAIKNLKIIEKLNSKIPANVISLLIVLLIAFVLVFIIQGPSYIFNLLSGFNDQLFNPVTGRWKTTVAENKQPYFTEWGSTFGPILGNFPVMFWIFIFGSILLFREMTNKLTRKDSWLLTGVFVIFLFGIIFSRYSASSLLDGLNILSRLIYYFAVLLFIGVFLYYYIIHHKEGNDALKKIDLEYILLFALFVLCLITARSAIRLIMVLSTITPIFLAYLCVNIFERFKEAQDSNKRIIIGVFLILIICLSLFVFVNYLSATKQRAYNSVPYFYTNQWQNAMSWVRNSTSTDAVFAHWWDYGYWVQSIGNRATVTDGGNLIVWWNYLTGRLVLTGDNQKDSLDFLYSHNATHLLIDSSDIGKYGAFSQIGSDVNYDRLSSGPVTLLSDSTQIKETKEETIRTYNVPAGNGRISIFPIEEDLQYDKDGTKITLFKENSGVAGINVHYSIEGLSMSFLQPEIVFYSEGRQLNLPIRYIYYNNELLDFKTGVPAAIRIIPRVGSTSVDKMGAAIYVSPRVLRGFLGQVYVLDNSMKNFNNFELAHSEPDVFSTNLKNQGYDLGDFSYFDGLGLQGPIKIWNIKYTGKETVKSDYLLKSVPDYISWKF
jgi:asparagine N-glycosylation enzyme membrane subunit Stt3